MHSRIASFLAVLMAFGFFCMGCRHAEIVAPPPAGPAHKSDFIHKTGVEWPLVKAKIPLPTYRKGEWVEFEPVPQQSPCWSGWLMHFWQLETMPAGGVWEGRVRLLPENGASVNDHLSARFFTPGKWGFRLFLQDVPKLSCPKCKETPPSQSYCPGTKFPCPRCKSEIQVPAFDVKNFKTVGSELKEIIITDLRPRRFVYGDPSRGDDLPIVSTFPEGGWAYVGERLQVSLFGLRMHLDTGNEGFFPAERVIRKVVVDFGDGTKTEEYENASATEEISHRLLDHVYLENGEYTIKADVTDSKGESWTFTRQFLAVNKPTSGMDRLTGKIVEELMAGAIAKDLVGKNIIIYNLENLETYSDDNEFHPLEDQLVMQLHERGVRVLERDQDLLKRWVPEVLGVMPNTFSLDMRMCRPDEWAQLRESFQVEAARPDLLFAYRIVELNERLEPHRKFDPAKNRMVSELELTAGEAKRGESDEGTVQVLRAMKRARVLKLYIRVVDGRKGAESTAVLYTGILSGAAEDFVIVSDEDAGSVGIGATSIRDCPSCKAANDIGKARPGQRVRCFKCGNVFEVIGETK